MKDQGATRHMGRSIPMREAEPLLRGQGTYVSDLRFPGMLHAAVLRSPHAHARIRAVDAERRSRDAGRRAGPYRRGCPGSHRTLSSELRVPSGAMAPGDQARAQGAAGAGAGPGQGALRGRAGGHGGGRGPLPGRGRARRRRRGLRGAAAGGGPGGGAGTGRGAGSRGRGRQRRVPLQHRQGRRGTSPGERAPPHRGTPAPPPPRRHPHGGKRRRGHGRGQAAPADRVVVHPGSLTACAGRSPPSSA